MIYTASKTRYSALTTRLEFDRFRTVLIDLIVYLHLAYSIVGSSFFRAFIELLNVSALNLLPSSGNTIKDCVSLSSGLGRHRSARSCTSHPA